jgi:hypothetical protein
LVLNQHSIVVSPSTSSAAIVVPAADENTSSISQALEVEKRLEKIRRENKEREEYLKALVLPWLPGF